PSEVNSLADPHDTFLVTPLVEPADDDAVPVSPDARVRFARLATAPLDLRLSLADPLADVLHRGLPLTRLADEPSAPPHGPRRPLSRRRRRGQPAGLPGLPAHRRPVREGPRQRARRR